MFLIVRGEAACPPLTGASLLTWLRFEKRFTFPKHHPNENAQVVSIAVFARGIAEHDIAAIVP